MGGFPEDLWSELGEEERLVVVHLARRILTGQGQYGRLHLATDGRDWRKERADELSDVIVYTAYAEVARMLK